MRTYKASMVTDTEIVLLNASELPMLYEDIKVENNFIVEWTENEKVLSKVMIGTNIIGKVKNSEIELKAMEI